MEKDPLKRDDIAAPGGKELFEKFSQCAEGFSVENAMDAAINVLLNAIRQTYSTRDKAAKAFDEKMGRAKHLLLEKHYHGDGSRRNIFPFEQRIEVPPPEEWQIGNIIMGKKTKAR